MLQFHRIVDKWLAIEETQTINFAYYPLKSVPPMMSVFIALTSVSLRHIGLKKFPEDFVAELPGLIQLDVAFNRIKQLPLNGSKLCRLQELDLSYNRLKICAALPDIRYIFTGNPGDEEIENLQRLNAYIELLNAEEKACPLAKNLQEGKKIFLSYCTSLQEIWVDPQADSDRVSHLTQYLFSLLQKMVRHINIKSRDAVYWVSHVEKTKRIRLTEKDSREFQLAESLAYMRQGYLFYRPCTQRVKVLENSRRLFAFDMLTSQIEQQYDKFVGSIEEKKEKSISIGCFFVRVMEELNLLFATYYQPNPLFNPPSPESQKYYFKEIAKQIVISIYGANKGQKRDFLKILAQAKAWQPFLPKIVKNLELGTREGIEEMEIKDQRNLQDCFVELVLREL